MGTDLFIKAHAVYSYAKSIGTYTNCICIAAFYNDFPWLD